ncbi:hypothetical protein [Leptospira sp. GIMC2001]|uniref:hypothetical protein n=1 Tax=Leptospira sp. GIMC2001 TaxID=1513297 RepID=UPI0023495878|nr:hypothetical protein [Leptospira sp. GIMC2001]WCL47693.1 hypothetical protein O4O04_00110 [Leptospira sp. GIMC2001]
MNVFNIRFQEKRFSKFVLSLLHSKKFIQTFQLIISIGILSFFLNCAEKRDYQEEYNERILLQLFLQPTPNPQSQCENSFVAKSACLSQTSSQTAPTDSLSLATVYYVLFNQVSPNTTELSSTCSSLLSGRFFSRFTPAAADCFFSCKQNIWANLNTNSRCSVPFTSLYNLELENNRNLDCIQSCQAITNTPSL